MLELIIICDIIPLGTHGKRPVPDLTGDIDNIPNFIFRLHELVKATTVGNRIYVSGGGENCR